MAMETRSSIFCGEFSIG
ncbi:hypothetical protein Zm00014a_041789 [Zea mays]|uniref:Uncharacterized protein n=1 Tax=Zea mays TaxID=4577 RepID=A0A317YAK8_MAIZE|nr:hypothetical protein Zm00014a_041789 [Zea mays]